MRGGVLLTLLLLAPVAAQAQAPLKQSEWLPKGSTAAGDLLHRPREALEGGANQNFYVEFGRLAFRSPEILGGNARRAGLSCNACHVNGDTNARFFAPGLSDRPGEIDVTHALWNLRGEDGAHNPPTIPTLRNVATKPRLGHDGRVASLREFARSVIVTEFAGTEPSPLVLDALTAYMTRLRTPPPGEESVSLATDLADFDRDLKVLRVALLDEDAALTELTVRMIRGQIGFIAERFHKPAHDAARAALADWVDRLRGVERLAQAGDFPAARKLADGFPPAPQVLRDAEATSLYDAVTVQRELR